MTVHLPLPIRSITYDSWFRNRNRWESGIAVLCCCSDTGLQRATPMLR